VALVDVENLKIHFLTRKGTVKAVDGVSFSVRKNETLGLIGESGCGKTTIALSMIRLVKPPGRIVEGKIVFGGSDIVPMPRQEIRHLRGRDISIVRQEAQNALNPVMTIGKQIIEMILQHERVTKEEAAARARNQLDLVGISDQRMDSYPHEFSGGMKQRAMVAMATACNPKFLILDEPTTGLDVIVQRQLLSLIRDLKMKLHLTAVLITHDLAVIAETCDWVAVMYAGKIVEQADTASLYRHPMHPYSQGLIGAYPSLKGEKRALKSIPGAPPRLIDPPRGCRFQPRCPYATDVCEKEEPMVIEKEGHLIACHQIQ
jgi:oligopeptide/dipeptide ABC transporter ATP-binding protein